MAKTSSRTAFLCDNFSLHFNERALDMYLNEEFCNCTFLVENAAAGEKKVRIQLIKKFILLYNTCHYFLKLLIDHDEYVLF